MILKTFEVFCDGVLGGTPCARSTHGDTGYYLTTETVRDRVFEVSGWQYRSVYGMMRDLCPHCCSDLDEIERQGDVIG